MTHEFDIATTFMPNLSHIATVKIAVSFCNKFDERTLDQAMASVEGKPLRNKGLRTEIKSKTALQKLLFIPAHLRKKVMEAVHGLRIVARRFYELYFEPTDAECVYYWRFDGTFDAVKTAQQLVENANIEIRKRFKLACCFCLEESIRSLWTEMEKSGQTENLEIPDHSIVHFWVRWVREGSQSPWRQAAVEFLNGPEDYYVEARISAFFPSLLPEERKNLLCSCLRSDDEDDFLVCVCAMTEDEEEKMMNLPMMDAPLIFMCSYLKWPFQSLFLEKFEKMSRGMSHNSVAHNAHKLALLNLLCRTVKGKDFDYFELFCSLWVQFPIGLREMAKQYPDFDLSKNVNSCLNQIRRRKARFNQRRNKKMRVKKKTNETLMWMRKNGRLQSTS